MSSYFDKFDASVRDLSVSCGTDTEGFLKGLKQLEEKLKTASKAEAV